MEIMNKILNSDCSFLGKDIPDKRTPESIIKNALREINQKQIKNCKITRDIKKKYKKDDNSLECPLCNNKVPRLTCAHVGKPVSKIIDDIIDNNPGNYDIIYLNGLIKKAHEDIVITVCCDACNKSLEE